MLALVTALAATWAGCGESAPPATAPRMVSVLGTGSERATGFTLAPGRVVTVAHALERGRAIRVRAGRAAPRSARLLRVDRRADLALLAAPSVGGPTLEISTAGHEADVHVLALRGGRVVTVRAAVRRAIDAHVSAPGAERALSRPALELEAPIRAGDSGAPVLTERGELAGVVFARSRTSLDTAYAVDAGVLERLRDAGRR